MLFPAGNRFDDRCHHIEKRKGDIKMKKRVLACLAALTLAMSLLPVTALAEEGTTSGGGSLILR